MKPEGYIPKWGKLALKLLVAKSYKSGLELNREELGHTISRIAKATGLSPEDIKELFARIIIPSATKGVVATSDTKLTSDNVSEMTKVMMAGMSDNEVGRLEQAALAVVRYEGRSIAPADFARRKDELLRVTGAPESELMDFYLTQIVAPALGWLYGVHNVSINLTTPAA